MDAYNRRLNIFKSELEDDIKMFNGLIETKDHDSIKAFAHKYKMRLTYFKYDVALSLCNKIEQMRNKEDNELIISASTKFLHVLNNILIELKDESISS